MSDTAPQKEQPAPVPAHVEPAMPMYFRDFITSLRGTPDAIYGRMLRAAHGRRAMPLTEWQAKLTALKGAPLPATTHGVVVNVRGRRR